MRRIQPTKPANPATCRLLLWLIAALLFGQSFGSIHRIVHASGRDSALMPPVAVVAETNPSVGKSSLAHWFGGHGAGACALIDHALQPTPPAVPALLAAPALVAALPPAAMPDIVPASQPSPFEARGPPSLFC